MTGLVRVSYSINNFIHSFVPSSWWMFPPSSPSLFIHLSLHSFLSPPPALHHSIISEIDATFCPLLQALICPHCPLSISSWCSMNLKEWFCRTFSLQSSNHCCGCSPAVKMGEIYLWHLNLPITVLIEFLHKLFHPVFEWGIWRILKTNQTCLTWKTAQLKTICFQIASSTEVSLYV